MKPSSRGPLRLGLIGCGGIAYWAHLRNLPRIPSLQLVAAADPDPEARRRASTLTRAPILADASELLARDDVEAVLIAAPTHCHAALALQAASARKHLYLEKPLATEATAAQAVVAAVEQAGILARVGFNRRFHPVHNRARQLLRDGRIGRIVGGWSTFCEPGSAQDLPPWKKQRATGGGVLLDLASHHFDLIHWLLDDPPVEVHARIESHASEHGTAYTRVTLASGLTFQSFFSFGAGPTDAFELIGERGTLRIDRHRAMPELRIPRRLGYGLRRPWIPCTPGELLRRALHVARPGYDPSYRSALAAFAAAARGTSLSDEGATLRDALASLNGVLAAERSATLGAPVPIPPVIA